jgi:hypothetical protein
MSDNETLIWKVTILMKGRKMEVITLAISGIQARRQILKLYPEAHVLDLHVKAHTDSDVAVQDLPQYTALYTSSNAGQLF